MTEKTQKENLSEIPSRHWADTAADELIKLHAGKNRFVCASGISPSGVVHIGNFREVITVDLVARALEDRGKEVRFLYSWDDYDAFRKVPANLPHPEALEKELRKPLAQVKNPFGEGSYASHFEKIFEAELAQVGIVPDFIYQNQAYQACKYAEGIQHALENQAEIKKILDKYRTEPLPDSWSCVSVYCESCFRDTTEILKFTPPSKIDFKCKACKKNSTLDFKTQGRVKLLWRVDWPMRWAHENVDFEPGGKDHSSEGGSYDTGAEIIRKVWKKEPPFYVQYDFVLAKGMGAKFSSSTGNLISLGEALEIYEPAVLRWIFSSRKPNLDFSIAFDLDVLKTYDEFDRCERIAFKLEEAEEKKFTYEKRIYELASLSAPNYKKKLVQFPLRHLCNILQIYEGNLAAVEKSYGVEDAYDKKRLAERSKRAWNWLQKYAPEDFKFHLRKPGSAFPELKYPDAIQKLISCLKSFESNPPSEEVLSKEIFQVMKSSSLDAKTFFPEVYRVLIQKNSGPKLAGFILTIGIERSLKLLTP